MGWPSRCMPTDSDARLAMHMHSLHASAPRTYSLTTLVRKRLGWSWNKYYRARDRACQQIADDLNYIGSEEDRVDLATGYVLQKAA